MKRQSLHRTRALPAALLAAVIALAASALPATALSPTPKGSAAWNLNQLIGYKWAGNHVPPSWMKSAINGAAADSTASRASKAARLVYDSSAASWVSYTDNMPAGALGYVSYKSVSDNEFHVKMRVQGWVFDWGTLKWCQYYDSPPSGCFDAETIALHEFGHVQGLDHVHDKLGQREWEYWTDSVMHPTMRSKSSTGWNMHAFGRCDVARLQMMYGPLDSYTHISTCLSVDTRLTFSSSASYVDYGKYVTFTSYLRIADDATGKELGGNPLSGRSVVLQYRPLGGSGWTKYGSMTPSVGGKYTVSVAIRSDREWRAKFAAPSDEGLNGSFSGTVTVRAVNACGCVTQSGGA